MKCYLMNDRIQLVGKAWEVLAYLKKMQKDNPFGHVPLSEILGRIN